MRNATKKVILKKLENVEDTEGGLNDSATLFGQN